MFRSPSNAAFWITHERASSRQVGGTTSFRSSVVVAAYGMSGCDPLPLIVHCRLAVRRGRRGVENERGAVARSRNLHDRQEPGIRCHHALAGSGAKARRIAADVHEGRGGPSEVAQNDRHVGDRVICMTCGLERADVLLLVSEVILERIRARDDRHSRARRQSAAGRRPHSCTCWASRSRTKRGWSSRSRSTQR